MYGCRDQRLVEIETKIFSRLLLTYFLIYVAKTSANRSIFKVDGSKFENFKIVEMEIFSRSDSHTCRDRDFYETGNFKVVEAEIHTRPPNSRLSRPILVEIVQILLRLTFFRDSR